MIGSLGNYIKKLRLANSLPLRKVAAELDIDQSILCKIENNKRKPNRELITKIASFFKINENDLLIQLYSDEFVEKLYNDDFAFEVLKVAEEKLRYSNNKK